MREVGLILPVILSGPLLAGEEFREPVQFHQRGFGQSLLQNTIARFDSDLFHRPVIVALEDQVELIHRQISALGMKGVTIITEPTAKGTMNCAILAALFANTFKTKPLILLSPSDQHVQYPQSFRRSIAATIPVVCDGYVATFGIKPDYPETDYAYLHKGESLRPGTFLVDHFIEKPDQTKARELIGLGGYYWNTGTYLFEADVFLAQASDLDLEAYEICEAAFKNAMHSDGLAKLPQDIYSKCEASYIEKAIMEKIDNRALIPVHIGWSDRGGLFDHSGEITNPIGLAS